MTMLESVGGQSAVVKTGEDPQVNLTPDAETLALFAGLFAMLQTPDEAVDGETADIISASPDISALVAGDGASGQQPQFDDLPAAAKLMLDGGPSAAMPTDHADVTQSASLASLLIAAKSLSEGVDQPISSGRQTGKDTTGDAPTGITTAKAILARAIEILDDIDASSDQVAADDLDPELNLLAPSGQPPATGYDQAATEAANSVTVQPAPSEDFIGPMPAMPVVSGVVRMTTQQAPSDEFVGPMPAIPVGENAARIMTQPAPSPAFVGPMPAMVLPATVPPTTVPPTKVPPTTGGPVQLIPQPAPSTTFVGPMPLQPVPLQPVPLSGQDGMGLGQAGLGQTGLGQAGLGQAVLGQAVLGQAGLGQYGSWQPDVATPDEGGEPLMPKRDIFDQKGAGPGLDQIKSRQEMVMNAGPRFGPAGNQMVSPDLVPRDLRAHAEQTAMTGGHSSSGPSASGTSSSGGAASSQTIAATGQGGGQAGGHSQSGQGGGQASSYGFADTGTSRDLTDRAMLHRLNTANAGWSDTMIKRLTSDLRSGVQTVRIILEPRHLGRLNVDLGLRNGKASIRIAAETAEAAKLLGSARGQLGHMLEQSGMRLASFQTSAGGQDASMDGGAGQQGHAQPDGDGKNTGRDKGFSNKVTAADDSISQADDGLEDQDHAPRKGETAVLSILA